MGESYWNQSWADASQTTEELSMLAQQAREGPLLCVDSTNDDYKLYSCAKESCIHICLKRTAAVLLAVSELG